VLAQMGDTHACAPMITHTVRGEAKWARGGGGALAPQLPRAIRVGPNEECKKFGPSKSWSSSDLNTGGLSDFLLKSRGLSSKTPGILVQKLDKPQYFALRIR